MSTVYSIQPTDTNEPPFNINPAQIDGFGGPKSNSSLILHGTGRLKYGKALNENFLHLLENFASPARTLPLVVSIQEANNSGAVGTHVIKMFDDKTNIFIVNYNFQIVGSTANVNDNNYSVVSSSYDQPSNLTTIILQQSLPDDQAAFLGNISYNAIEPDPILVKPPYNIGQLWFNKTDNVTYVYKDITGSNVLQWAKINAPENLAILPIIPVPGSLFYNTTIPQLEIFDGTNFVSVADRYVLKSGDTMDNSAVLNFGTNLSLNLGAGNPSIGADIQSSSDMLLVAEDNFNIIYDGNNNLAGELVISQKALNTSSSTPIFRIENDGTLHTDILNYENLVIDDNDIPNKRYTEDRYMPISTNIPVSKVGRLDFLPLKIAGSFDGAAVPTVTGMVVLFRERSGILVGLRPGHNGNFKKFFYFYSLTGNLNSTDIVITDFEYKPSFLLADEYISTIHTVHSFNKGFGVIVNNTSGNPIKKYWIFNNGTMDPSKHTFRDVTTITGTTTDINNTFQYIDEFNLWLVVIGGQNTIHTYEMYDNNFTLLTSSVVFNRATDINVGVDIFGDSVSNFGFGFRQGGAFQYYNVTNNTFRISEKIGIFLGFPKSLYAFGMNLRFDYNVSTNLFSVVDPYPYNIDVTDLTNSIYPIVSYNQYSYFRDKLINVDTNLIITGTGIDDPSGFSIRTFPTLDADGISWDELNDNFGKIGYQNIDITSYIPDDASVLGKSLSYSMWISNNILLAKSQSKDVSTGILSTKYSINNIANIFNRTSLVWTSSPAFEVPSSTAATLDSILTSARGLSSVIRDNGTFQTRYFDTTNFTVSTFDGTSGTAINLVNEITLPANYATQVENILLASNPAISSLNLEHFSDFNYISNNLFYLTVTTRDPANNDLVQYFQLLRLSANIFTDVSGITITLSSLGITPNIQGASGETSKGYGVFEDTSNDIIYVMFPTTHFSIVGDNRGSLNYVKIQRSTDNVVSFIHNNSRRFSDKLIAGIHPQFGFYYSYSRDNSFSARALIYHDSALLTSQDRARESIELILTNTASRPVQYELTIQPATGFNLYYSDFPLFLNGSFYAISSGSIDISTLYPNPYNSTFYIFAELVLNVPLLTISDIDLPESNTIIKIGTIITDQFGIINIDFEKSSRVDGSHTSLLSRSNGIPIADSSGKIDQSWLNTIGNSAEVGSVLALASSILPTNYLKCNGAAVSRTTYANLFAIINTIYGPGDGSTTFNLPDLRGEFIRGWDDGRGVDLGRAIGTFQADDLKSHNHEILNHNGGGGSVNIDFITGLSNSSFNQSAFTQFTGGNDTRPRNISLMYIIKY